MKRTSRLRSALMTRATVLTLIYAINFHTLGQEAPRYAGSTEKGFLLPNGWTLRPAGEHIPQSDLPLNIIAMPNNKHALIATSGYNSHDLSLVDIMQKRIVDHQTVGESWFGLAASPGADRVWWAGGGGGSKVHAFRLANDRLCCCCHSFRRF